ncbi:polysaccharide biosynthesis C-terminal domain-containing protein [Acidipila sp. EB88]|uniref:polysaccharide biosynthesis C-terminal domain-containing protein n=1 Tax=Acidipila sp. EB88 TaxID=2305226 RepID=UPI002103A330|nr:polysaccharide biosynthesis C-terminal domain-containing protein [Acidipila sp. EB88]
MYGNKYDGAAGILRILLGEAILDGVTSVLAQAFMARGLPGTVTLLEGCGLFTAVPLMYWLIPRYGLQGAAYALLLATACRFSFVIGSYPLRLGMKIPSMMLRASDVSAFRRAR